MEKIRPDFTDDSIAETLLLTVALRAFDTRQQRPILGDQKSVELMQLIDYDFEQFAKGSMMSRLGTNVRCKYFDACARKYIPHTTGPSLCCWAVVWTPGTTVWAVTAKRFFMNWICQGLSL